MTNKDEESEKTSTVEITKEKEELNLDRHESTSNKKEEVIGAWLQKVKFRRKLFGIDEADVWEKIQELNEKYEEALKAERIRYDVLLEEKCKARA